MDLSRSIRSLLLVLFGVCPILFFTDLTRNPYYTQITLLNILIPACWLIWLYQSWKAGELVWVSTSMDVAIGSLMLVSLLSWALTAWAHPSFLQSIYSEGSKAYIFLIVNTYLVYLCAIRISGSTLVRHVLWITYAVCFVAAVYGICQYFGIELVWPNQLNPYGNRPVSTFGNPNFMSSYLVVVIPVIVADYLLHVTGVPRALLFMLILLSLGALLATLTRSSWVGLVVGVLVLAGGIRLSGVRVAKGQWMLWAAMGALVFLWPQAGSTTYTATVIDRVMEAKKMTHEAYGSAYQRFLIWLSAWGMVQDHPFLGKGWGCFELFYPFYQGPLLLEKGLNLRTHANNAHNELLEYWSQVGTIGLGMVVWMWVLFFRQGTAIARRLAESWRGMMWGFMGGVAGMLVDNLLNVSVHFAVPALIFWWWVGCAMSLDAGALRIRKIDLRSVWRKSLVVVTALGLLALMGRSVCLWAGEISFFNGFKLSKAGVDLVSAARDLNRAYEWHHLEVNNNYELGNIYARLGDRDKALFMYQRALDANAGYDEIYFNRATLLMQMGRPEAAIVNYRRCLAINPMSQQAYNALGGLYFKDIARYGKELEALYVSGTQTYPLDKDLWNNLGYLYTQRQDWAHAAAAYEKAISIDPQFQLARQNLAVVMAKANAASKH